MDGVWSEDNVYGSRLITHGPEPPSQVSSDRGVLGPRVVTLDLGLHRSPV